MHTIVFETFEDISIKALSLLQQPPSNLFDFKIDQSKPRRFGFDCRYTGNVNISFNKLLTYRNIIILHPYYMRNALLIIPHNDTVYIGQRDYDILKNNKSVELYVNQIGSDPYARLNKELFIVDDKDQQFFNCQLGPTIKHKLFEHTSTGEFEFYIAKNINSVATNTDEKHKFLYKYCNLDSRVVQSIEQPYVYWYDRENGFMIDGDNIDNPDDFEVVSFSDRLQHIKKHGIDPLMLQLIQVDGFWHLRLWPGSYISWLDWIFVNLCGFDQIPACIIIGNTQYDEHQYKWRPFDKEAIVNMLQPEFKICD